MKALLTKKTLADACDVLTRVVPSKSSNPVLTSMLLTPGDGTLTLSGTNAGEMDVRVSIPAEFGLHDLAAPTLLPAHLFAQMVKNLPGVTVDLEVRSGTLKASSGGSDFSLTPGDADAFPALSFEQEHAWAQPVDELLGMLGNVSYAASQSAFQAAFRAVRLEYTPDHVRTVGSDGYRIAYHTASARTPHTAYAHIPVRSVPVLSAIFKAGRGSDMQVSIKDHILTLTTPAVSLNVRLLEDAYPDYTRPVPTIINRTVDVDAVALKESINRLQVMTEENANYRMEVRLDGPRLTLTTQNDYGRAQDTLDATQGGPDCAEPFEMALNARYLREALAGRTGTVTLHVSSSTAPLRLTDSGTPGHHGVLVALRS